VFLSAPTASRGPLVWDQDLLQQQGQTTMQPIFIFTNQPETAIIAYWSAIIAQSTSMSVKQSPRVVTATPFGHSSSKPTAHLQK